MIRPVLFFLFMMMLSGCSALKTSRFAEPAPVLSAGVHAAAGDVTNSDATMGGATVGAANLAAADSLLAMGVEPLVILDSLLRAEAQQWMGTPYLLGGMSSTGIDCSALIQNIFGSALLLTLPRTTEQQVNVGARVRRNQLDTGDLVFFRPEGRGRHAGIVLSNGEFLHASTSQGVMISHLDEPHWERWYHTGRRVVDDRWSPTERLAESSGN